MKLALDTNTYRAFMDGEKKAVELVRQADVIGMPVPVLAELRFGFLSGTRGRQNEAVLQRFLDSPRIQILPCDYQTSHYYSEIKLQLKKQGTPIPINDVWIAALTSQHGMTLFSYDRDFDNIPQLPRA
jgi:tRNA(fMet)-specific endonuclease VapC